MPPQHSRRAFIQSIGGVSFTILAGSATAASGTTDESTTLSAAELVIPETAVPAGFEQYSAEVANRGSAPFIEKLHHLNPRFKLVDTARNAFWKGKVESDPQWVLSSIALVGADRLPRLHMEKAANVFYDAFIDEYNAKTSVMIEFQKSHSERGNEADWHVDILEAPLLSETEPDPSPIRVERMHQQFLANVFLGTIVFGSADGSPSVESLSEEFATVQRDRYDSVRSTQ